LGGLSRNEIIFLGLLLLVGSCAIFFAARSPKSPYPDRVVLIVVDTLRRDHVGVYGGRAETPHIDKLAARGQVAPRALASFPSTTMSMGALFAGLTPSIESGNSERSLPWTSETWCGLSRVAPPGSKTCFPAGIPTLPEQMRTADFETIGVTSNPLLYRPAGFERGFDIWEEAGAPDGSAGPGNEGGSRLTQGAYGGTTAGSVISAVRAALGKRSRDRFFLYVHFMDAHDFELAGVSYAEGVKRADAGVGQLLQLLGEQGLLEDSLVVLTSDHGERLGEKHPVEGRDQHFGNPPFDYLLRVPLISVPPLFEFPHYAARSQDLAQLILARAGALAGRPPVFLSVSEVFLSEWDWQTLRSGRWKGAFRRDGSRALLFDLKEDPGEKTDLSEVYPDRLNRMRYRVSILTREYSGSSSHQGIQPAEVEPLRSMGDIEALDSATPEAAD
jgi:arylsulfatase A-like enzyme